MKKQKSVFGGIILIINGLMKMTLLDFPGRVACTVFTAGCNMRCPFCHNALLVTDIHNEDKIEEEDFFSFLKKRKGLLDGVAITGGEPLLQKDIGDFIKRIKDMGFSVKLDSNGSIPEKLAEITESGEVDYVAMDIKNSPEKYPGTVGVPDFDITPVKESVNILLSGKTDYEFRTTVVNEFHTVGSIEKAAEWIKGAKRYFLQAFKDSGNLIGGNMSGVSKEEMELMKTAAEKYVSEVALRGI